MLKTRLVYLPKLPVCFPQSVITYKALPLAPQSIMTFPDDVTFEQIKKQLNTMVEVIKVVDLTDMPIHMKEVLFAKIKSVTPEEKAEAYRIAQTFKIRVVDTDVDALILESCLTERKNNDLCQLLRKTFKRIDIVRGGAVAMEGLSTSCR